MNQYKVLWFDDEHESLEIIKDDAKLAGISLIGFTNAEEGLRELERNFTAFDAIIVDGNFYKIPGQSGDVMDDGAMFNVGIEIEKYSPKKKIPWFILSGQINFTKEINKYAQGFKKRVYDKSKDSDIESLWNDMKAEADLQIETQLRYEYRYVFELCTEGYLGTKSSDLILSLIILSNENDFQFSQKDFNDLRKILEILFDKLNKIGLIPDEIFEPSGWFNPSGYFLNGKHKKYIINEGVIHPTVAFLLNQIIQVVQDACHILPEKLRLKTNQFISQNQTPYLFRSTLNQLFDVLIWFKNFIDQNPDPENNKLLYTVLGNQDSDNESNWIKGTVSKIGENGFGVFQPLDGGKTIGIHPQKIKEFQLAIDAEIEITTKPDPTGTKTYIDQIKKT